MSKCYDNTTGLWRWLLKKMYSLLLIYNAEKINNYLWLVLKGNTFYSMVTYLIRRKLPLLTYLPTYLLGATGRNASSRDLSANTDGEKTKKNTLVKTNAPRLFGIQVFFCFLNVFICVEISKICVASRRAE